MERKADWTEIDRLIKELKLQEAQQRLDEILPAIRESGDAEEITRALVRGAQLRAGSAEPGEAVRFLQSQPWPEGRRQRAVLSLFMAEALKNYYDNYRWKIWENETVLSDQPVDVERWTTGQIFEAVSKAYLEAWKERELLGGIPVTQLSDILKPNNYPKEVRGTLRDTVAYLWSAHLADTGYWSPAQTNAASRLDLIALLRDGELADEQLVDAETHPLRRIMALLADHERWHLSKGNRDGALEARLERYRQLQRHALSDETKALRQELEKDLPEFQKIPWWAMGMAELARLYQHSGDLAKALEIARAAQKTFPKSPGGEQARAMAREIEVPVYHMDAMASDGLHRRSVQVQHKNLPALWFRAYPIDLRQRLARFDRRNGQLFPGMEEVLKSKPAYAWKVDLPATPDYQVHATYVTPPIDRKGAWLVLASGREDFATLSPDGKRYLDNLVLAAPMVLGDMVLVAREHEGGRVEVAAVSGETGEPLSGFEVTRYDLQGGGSPQKAAEGLFDLDERGSHAFFASRGDDVALLLHPYRYRPHPERTGKGTLVFTDRSIYRPQQKIFWKVLVYDNQGRGRLRAVPRTSVTVGLVDPNGQEVESRTVAANDFGTASGEMVIPTGRPLGPWTIRTSLNGAATIRVEEYKRPTFEVTLEDPKGPLRLNHPAAFPGQARYYFGLPVTRGEVRWRAIREARSLWWWWAQTARQNEETVATGTVEISSDGTFEVAFTPEAGELDGLDPAGVTFFYRIEAELTDEGGETRSAQRSFRLGHVAIEAEILSDRQLYAAGEPGAVKIHRRDLAGIGRAGQGTWTLFTLSQPAETPLPADIPRSPADMPQRDFLTEGDRLRPRSNHNYDPQELLREWEDGPEVASGTLAHGKDGMAELALPALAPGAYRLRYETKDEAGETFSAWKELIVAGEDTPLALPALLLADASEARPGGKVRVLAHSGFPDQTVWLEVWHRYDLTSRRELRMGRDSSLVEIPIGPEDRGGFSLRLVTLRDYQIIQLDQHVNVPWDDRKLEVEVATFRDRIRPGTRETWTVKVRPAEGQETAAAELLAYLYDRSLDLFAPHQPANPLGLYPNNTGAGWSSSSLGSSSVYGAGHGWQIWGYDPGQGLHPDELRFAQRFRQELAETMAAEGAVAGMAAPPPPPPPPPMAASPAAMNQKLVSSDLPIDQSAAEPAPGPAPELRSDFSETAFWQPHLIAGPDGTAAIEFDVPDSVTSWSFWVHAVTADIRAGSLQKEVRSVKDLMVRPYVPRFLRESDRALLEVVVNNASEGELAGTVQLDVVDPATGGSLLAEFGIDPAKARAPFTVAAGGGTSITFPLTAPKRVGPVAFRVTAVAGNVSDGELRPLPVLPSRMHLAQSRFAALKDTGPKELRFDDMAKSDPTRIDEQMVVTLDAQLFYSVLEALPYLVDYPYECTEQTLNRFLSTGIAASLFDEYPAVAAMAEQLSKRETRLETWDAVDPNRKMTLEETPWLQTALGGADPGLPLIKVLDPKVARAQRDQSLAKLQEAQLDNGGFPWWPGGQASPYMTIYLLYGFAKAAEAGIEVPEDMVERAWAYVVSWYREQEEERKRLGKKEDDCCRELRVFMNYVATTHPNALPAEERKRILDDSFAHWKELSGYLKVLLALTLNRMERPNDARLVFDAVMDLAKTTEEEGTFFAPEKEAWLWYQDRIETHAFALLAMNEIAPEDPRRHGLVQWLFLNKQLNHWHSTKATAEVIYALVHYLEKEGQLGVRESATVRVAGQVTTFTFEPDRYTGKHNQVVVPGEKLGGVSSVVVEKESAPLMFASATWHFSTDQLPTEARGDLFGVTRRYFLRSGAGKEVTLAPLVEGTVLKPGDEVEVQLTITSRAPAEYVHLRDPRAAGMEPDGAQSGYKWDWTSPGRYEETRDSGTNFFFDWLPAGEYVLKYRLRANMGGTFRVGPATLQSMYAPEFTAYSAGDMMTVAPAAK